MKKSISIILSLLLVIIVLCSCSSERQEELKANSEAYYKERLDKHLEETVPSPEITDHSNTYNDTLAELQAIEHDKENWLFSDPAIVDGVQEYTKITYSEYLDSILTLSMQNSTITAQDIVNTLNSDASIHENSGYTSVECDMGENVYFKAIYNSETEDIYRILVHTNDGTLPESMFLMYGIVQLEFADPVAAFDDLENEAIISTRGNMITFTDSAMKNALFAFGKYDKAAEIFTGAPPTTEISMESASSEPSTKVDINITIN